MDLRQLEYFYTVSSLRNFTKAAQVLHVSQPSVSKAIQALESELKLTLFDRKRKNICLTDAGQVFLIHAKKILDDVKNAQISMERFQGNDAGVIHFGVPPMVESYLFPNFFIKFQSTTPDILIDLQECSDSTEVHEKLEDGTLDFGIVYLKAGETLENSITLLDDEFYLCLPQNHKLGNAEKISFKSLRNEKFILQPTGTFQNFITTQRSVSAGFSPEILLITSQLKTIKDLVSNDAAVSLLPKFAITSEKNFKFLPVDPPIKFSVALTWSKFKDLSPVGMRLLKFVESLFVNSDEVEISQKNSHRDET